ncbi:MAG: adenylate/guanylate cyclase domain-containing protein [Butyrivibrio sp.]|nr:adenylate/guanylate cyclase domain-containing protein [Acetatifactor muris]MCM1558379.1 adenylate/guanylate cyclase domain-containing protein [Butyrivibrio sp.]
MKRFLLIIIAAFFAGCLTLWAPFDKVEYWFCDLLYVGEKPVDNRIKIIGIDERSLAEMGPFSGWSRQQAADLLKAFDREHAPAVIAFDINFVGERDREGDLALAEAAEAFPHVVMASYINYGTRVLQSEAGEYQIDTMYVEDLELPYEALQSVTVHGFTNAVQDVDNYVRRSMLSESEDGLQEWNFAWKIYDEYQKAMGEQSPEPKQVNGIYGFDYTAEPGMYEVYSYVDVMEGRCDPKVFQDSIVLVGAYAQGMMDQYMVPIARGTVMNGVEVQANHVDALLNGRTFVAVNRWIQALAAFLVAGFYVWLVSHNSFLVNTVGGVLLEAGIIIAAKCLYGAGFYWGCFVPFAFVLIIFLVRVATGYLTERLRKRKILSVFRTYMAPQVVDELGRSGNYKIELGGRDREVAVLFVDIRGFTSMSEGLSPEKVVGILNRYLGMVTEAIFHNEGTLDKFIGDAVMAVYNAPLDVEDYACKAVQTGLDIVDAVGKINIELKKEFGIEIACGVGVHSGRAVVGNIGCSYRMDYTAIGDTVNVAERLESIAKGGQVLISRNLYEQVKDRYHAVFAGTQSLKGRQEGMEVFLVEGTNGTEAGGKNT